MHFRITRFFDIIFSLIVLVILIPVFVVVFFLIRIDSKGGSFYFQTRVGKNGKDFRLYKFRTMQSGSDKLGLITVGGNDNRITKTGYFMRKYKIDELPQFINVLKGDMSIVGPRPEVKEWTKIYPEKWKIVLSIKPGITDHVSVEFINEEEILALSADPVRTYKEEILPRKLNLYIDYVNNQSFWGDIKIIFKTIKVVILR